MTTDRSPGDVGAAGQADRAEKVEQDGTIVRKAGFGEAMIRAGVGGCRRRRTPHVLTLSDSLSTALDARRGNALQLVMRRRRSRGDPVEQLEALLDRYETHGYHGSDLSDAATLLQSLPQRMIVDPHRSQVAARLGWLMLDIML